MRIQNEIVSTRFNQFADMIDLDRYADERYTPDALVEMSRRLAEALGLSEAEATDSAGDAAGSCAQSVISLEKAKELRDRSEFGSIGLPYLVNRTVVEGAEGGADHE